MGLLTEAITIGSLVLNLPLPWVIVFASLLVIVVIFIFKRMHISSHKITIKLLGFEYTASIEKSNQNIFIANRIYVELITRKAAIEIDVENDVIVEVYDSWYTLFGIVRDEIKNVSGNNLRCGESNALIKLTIKILNEGLRPHLTQYQAKFRRWYDGQLPYNTCQSPQDIQKQYSEYKELIASMKKTNTLLIIFVEELRKFIYP